MRRYTLALITIFAMALAGMQQPEDSASPANAASDTPATGTAPAASVPATTYSPTPPPTPTLPPRLEIPLPPPPEVPAEAVRQPPSDEPLRIEHVAGSVYLLQGGGANTVVSAGDDGLLMMDTQPAAESEKVAQALESLSALSLKYVINSQWHLDHTGGNRFFGRNALIIGQEQCRRHQEMEGVAPDALPEITYRDRLSVFFNGEEVRVIHASDGFSGGDSVVYFTRSNVICLGDQYFAGRLPRIDVDHGGTVTGYQENIAQLLEQLPEGALIVPGHGPVSTAVELRQFAEMLQQTTTFIRDRARVGVKIKVLQEQGLPSPWGKWAWAEVGEKQYIENIFRGLEKERQKPPPPQTKTVPQTFQLIR